MPKRLLFVTTSTTRGGAEKILDSLARSIDRSKFSVAGIVCLKPLGAYGEALRRDGIPAWSLGLESWPGPGALFALRRIIEREKPDLVQALMYQAIQLTRMAKMISSHPFKLVGSPHINCRVRSRPTLWIDRALKSLDDFVVTESEASRSFLIAHQNYPPEKTKAVHNGIEVGPEPSRAHRLDKRRELGLAPDAVLIGTAGRLNVQKGHSVLIDAMAKFKDRPDAFCVILGEGPERKPLENQSRRLGLEGRVFLPGEKSDVPSWLSALDVFVLPSLWEGFPCVLLEAMAAGLPIIASGVDGVPEMIENGSSGVLAPAADAEILAGEIARLLEAPSDSRAQLGAKARSEVQRRFSLSGMMLAYEKTYLGVLDQKLALPDSL